MVAAEDVQVQGDAEAGGDLNVNQTGDQGAAFPVRRMADGAIDEPAQHVGTHSELQRIDRARGGGRRGGGRRGWGRRTPRAQIAWGGGGEEGG